MVSTRPLHAWIGTPQWPRKQILSCFIPTQHDGCHPSVKCLDTNTAATAIITAIDGSISPQMQEQDLPSTTVTCSAFPAMTKEGTTSARAHIVFIDCVAAHIVSTKSCLENRVADQIGGRVDVDKSCGSFTCRTQRYAEFRPLNDEDKRVPVTLGVRIAPELGASTIYVGSIYEKNVMVDVISKPPTTRNGNLDFRISIAFSRMLLLPLVLNEQLQRIHHTVATSDLWHRRIGTLSVPRAETTPRQEVDCSCVCIEH